MLTAIQNEAQPMTLKELIAQLKPDLGHWPDAEDWNMAFPLAGNLHRLENRGLIQRGRNTDQRTVWTAGHG